METMEQPAHRIEHARAPLWFGSGLTTWGEVVRAVDPAATQNAETPAPRKAATSARFVVLARSDTITIPRITRIIPRPTENKLRTTARGKPHPLTPIWFAAPVEDGGGHRFGVLHRLRD
jgi:hypothetical protein